MSGELPRGLVYAPRMSSDRLRLLLCEDHQIVREGLRALLSAEPDLVVVGETGDGAEAVRLAATLRPDVVLMDIGLSGASAGGIEATAGVRRACPTVQVVILSMYDDAATVDRAIRAGARGYVIKGRGLDTLVEAIRIVHRGETYLSPDVSHYVLGGYAGGGDPLSGREREVLTLLAEGLKGPQIAERLGLSAKTIENHRARIMEKLGIHSTAGLVRYALREGLAR